MIDYNIYVYAKIKISNNEVNLSKVLLVKLINNEFINIQDVYDEKLLVFDYNENRFIEITIYDNYIKHNNNFYLIVNNYYDIYDYYQIFNTRLNIKLIQLFVNQMNSANTIQQNNDYKILLTSRVLNDNYYIDFIDSVKYLEQRKSNLQIEIEVNVSPSLRFHRQQSTVVSLNNNNIISVVKEYEPILYKFIDLLIYRYKFEINIKNISPKYITILLYSNNGYFNYFLKDLMYCVDYSKFIRDI